MTTKLAIFEGKKIRRQWDKEQEKWYFSVVDIIQVLTGSTIPRRYWSDLKNKLAQEGSEMYEKIVQLKLKAEDGKMRITDTADVETLFRLIQFVPSPKAEPIKLWLAKVGYERIQEIADPEKSINRGRTNWQKLGRSQKWIQQRMMGQEIRNKLIDYWKNNEVKEKKEYINV
ncbi:MAG: BRO family protein [Candidatus Levybacteria bacterium]|nr:BRO family protein [Candidatus Levybacteria bacterium]